MKGVRLKTKIAGGVKPTARLVLCGALVAVPLLLLSTPGQRAHVTGDPQRSAGAGKVTRLVPGSALDAYDVAVQAAATANAIWAQQAAQKAAAQQAAAQQAAQQAAARQAAAQQQAAQQTAAQQAAEKQAAAQQAAAQQAAAQQAAGNQITGQASWYLAPVGTCASPTLPFGTALTVTDLATGASVHCVVEDRQGDAARVLDLSESDFAELASTSTGVIEVRLSW